MRGMGEREIAFGPFVFDAAVGALRRDGVPVAISSRASALLGALLAAAGQPVAKSALMEAAWPGTSVEESNLTVQIAALRKSLGEAPDGGEWIVTVPRVGYRLARRPATDGAGALVPAAGPDRPSIAVLAFTNMSSDPEQEFFADGLADDLITDLSMVPGLTVIARNSSFAYKGKTVDIRTIASELGVRYIVEGSVRRASARVRIGAKLIDAVDNRNLWAERFDRDITDVFALQDEVVARIVEALSGVLPNASAVPTRRPTSLAAYDLYVRARALETRSPEGNRTAQALLAKAVALDPNFAAAHAWQAISYHFGWMYWGQDAHSGEALAAAARALSLDPQNADAHMAFGYLRAYESDLDEGIAELEHALALNPNHADAWALFADIQVLQGDALRAIDCARNAFRLNPHPPSQYYWMLGWTEYAARRYEAAVVTLSHESTRGTGSARILAAALAQLGRMDEAAKEAAAFRAMSPHFSTEAWSRTQPFRHESDRRHFTDGYLKAGLPE
jgi:TolB-like protein/Tfp pilus assembly protein PilF